MFDYPKLTRMRLSTSAAIGRVPKAKVPSELTRLLDLCGPYLILAKPWPECVTVAPTEPMLSAVILANAPVRRDAADARWERLCRRWASKH